MMQTFLQQNISGITSKY